MEHITYERTTTDYNEARTIRSQTGGTISSFYSLDIAGNPILVYCITYKQLF